MRIPLLTAIICFIFFYCPAATHHVGAGQTFSTLSQAAAVAAPGDTILFHAGIYNGGQFYANLQGSPGNPIVIMPVPGDTVIHRGGNTAWQLSDAAYLQIHHLIFEQQAANGFNMDDGGDYTTPTHHIFFEHCIFRDMNASGNNDLLKLSGLDSFEIRHCTFLNGAAGGSGIDMVGCHFGVIANNHFENMGSNAIQAKGGTQHIRMEGNFFKNCGARSVNLGGSTGLQFFRPIDATFEAADLQVYSNIFIGSDAPVAYVGCERVEVVNNTMYLPVRWALRILQETVDTARFVKCGNNSFRNNIIYRNSSLSTDCNIGPNTDPQSFRFSNNLWFNYNNLSWSGPVLPVTDSNNIVGSDPLFANAPAEDFSIPSTSPAVAMGYAVSAPASDYAGNLFSSPRSIGAFEGNPLAVNIISGSVETVGVRVYPNPFHECTTVEINGTKTDAVTLTVFDLNGKRIISEQVPDRANWCMPAASAGVYYYLLHTDSETIGRGKIVKY